MSFDVLTCRKVNVIVKLAFEMAHQMDFKILSLRFNFPRRVSVRFWFNIKFASYFYSEKIVCQTNWPITAKTCISVCIIRFLLCQANQFCLANTQRVYKSLELHFKRTKKKKHINADLLRSLERLFNLFNFNDDAPTGKNDDFW